MLRQLIPTLPKLRRLVLLHTIPDSDILSLLSESPEIFYRIEAFIYLAFLHPPDKAAFSPAFSHITVNGSQVANLPYFTPDQLIQGLTDYTSRLTNTDGFYSFMSMCTRNGPELPLLAAYASVVREPGCSLSKRIVSFVPGSSSKALKEHKGWFFAWSVLDLCGHPTYLYAFAKINKKITEECQRRINELKFLPDIPQNSDGQATEDNSGVNTSLSDEELHVEETTIISEYADRQFHLFNIKSFFPELVKEGRPALSPAALTRLLELFEILGNKDEKNCAL